MIQRDDAGTGHFTTSLKLHNDFAFPDVLLSWYHFWASACYLFFSVNLSLKLQGSSFIIFLLHFVALRDSSSSVLTLVFIQLFFCDLPIFYYFTKECQTFINSVNRRKADMACIFIRISSYQSGLFT